MLTERQTDTLVLLVCIVLGGAVLIGIVVGLPLLAHQRRVECVERNIDRMPLVLAQEHCK